MTGSLSEIGGSLQRAAGAADRWRLFCRRKSINRNRHACGIIKSDTHFCITAKYYFFISRTVDVPALHDISADIKAGERVALVGPSGAGKSTLFHLLLRFYDPVSGQITFNGVDSRDLALQDLRQTIGLVPQEPALFSASLFDNIAFGMPDARLEDVMQAARKAEILPFIEALPEGFDSFVGEKGICLSGGQKQRIAIARVILRKPASIIAR